MLLIRNLYAERRAGAGWLRPVADPTRDTHLAMSEASRPRLPGEIARYYEEVEEERRLATGPAQLEFARTKEIVLR